MRSDKQLEIPFSEIEKKHNDLILARSSSIQQILENNGDSDIKEILVKEPFSTSVVYDWAIIHRLEGAVREASSWEWYRIIDGTGKMFKLRMCNSLQKKQIIMDFYDRLKKITGSDYYSYLSDEDNFLLFPWISDWEPVSVSKKPSSLQQIGTLLWEVNNEEYDWIYDEVWLNMWSTFHKTMKVLSKEWIVDWKSFKEFSNNQLMYEDMIWYDINDTHLWNFVNDVNEFTCLVDDDWGRITYKGHWITKFLSSNRCLKMGREETRKEIMPLLDWYRNTEMWASILSDKDYLRFIAICWCSKRLQRYIKQWETEKKYLVQECLQWILDGDVTKIPPAFQLLFISTSL